MKETTSQPTTDNQTAESTQIWPVLNPEVKADPQVEQKVKDLLAELTLEQKIAQMIQPEIRDITIEDMRKYGFGSYLNGGGSFPNGDKHATVKDWVDLAEAMYQASVDDSLDGTRIPTMWGTDAVHGHNNVIGATLFPHNIGLGAAHNPALIEQVAGATAREVMATGIDWVFAPTVAVTRDDRWGRTYEAYSEDPEILASYASAIVRGLQGTPGKDFLNEQRVISTVKHFVGDGGTEGGDDQGNNTASEQELFDIHAQGYVGGLNAGSQSVMASFNSWQGEKIHGSHYMLTQVLKERMGFDGFVVGDWNGHGQIPGCTNEDCPQAANAGLDMYMAPTPTWKPLYYNLIEQAKSGVIPMTRIDDAVTRILRVKVRAGLFDKPSPANRPLSGDTSLIGAKEHRDIARDAVRQSLVLLKNKNNILPLNPGQKVLVAGTGADNIGQQSGGWSITWQGTGNENSDFPGASSIWDGINAAVTAAGGQAELSVQGEFEQKPDVAIVVFGEQPYAEGNGDLDNLEYQRGDKSDLAMLQALKAKGIPVVSLFISGRPMWVNAELNASDAFVAVWLPGTEGQGVADVILTKADGSVNFDFHGKLSFSWPDRPDQVVNRGDTDETPLLPYGFGLRYGQDNTLGDDLNTDSGTTATVAQLVLFDRAVKAPYEVELHSGDSKQQQSANVQTFGALSVSSFDLNVQEDARLVSFDGSESAKIAFISAFPKDLRGYWEQGASLIVNYRLDQAPTAPVYLGFGCDHGVECPGLIDISEQLNQASIGEWQTLSVSLSCIGKAGSNLGQVFSPFTLKTDGKLTLAFSHIELGVDAQANTCDQ
ncbi:glucan 1,4-beta-glucosidase [Paraferrimonas sedimenticola]|uniref:Glucan 1,4-beta-glucosidase n=2 Tax=Paraferrimonas sedimenticola TaxID=375674 RepID=A0AA37W2H6_9GAMM|nr:glycoside hydrolase family 3 N-terminal domain-containing protein [Paraferrimonas sedimenticola]GLP97633.1 glucan 1,4-beta-glucosidase [Paraferrimonas sedimenticola]